MQFCIIFSAALYLANFTGNVYTQYSPLISRYLVSNYRQLQPLRAGYQCCKESVPLSPLLKALHFNQEDGNYLKNSGVTETYFQEIHNSINKQNKNYEYTQSPFALLKSLYVNLEGGGNYLKNNEMEEKYIKQMYDSINKIMEQNKNYEYLQSDISVGHSGNVTTRRKSIDPKIFLSTTDSPSVINVTTTEITESDDQKAFKCALMECESNYHKGPVCACNHKTGNTVTFKDECDLVKHNCRFDTAFKTIINEICPWSFESRSGNEFTSESQRYDYSDKKYYN